MLVITTPIDGTFEVVESWKGDLPVGEQIIIPELRPTANDIPISRNPKPPDYARGDSELIPREPVGSRMILFLKNNTDERAPANGTGETEGRVWKPSNMLGSMKASVVWIDGDQSYCFIQLLNPGPSVLSECSISEERVRNRVAEINSIQEKMTAVVAAKDGEERAQRLKPYVHSDVSPAQQFALEELGKSGPAAVGTIRGMLDDPAFSDEASELVKALVKAGGEAVGVELNNRLKQDLAFWKSKGPALREGWWNEDPQPHAPLRERYAQTYELILGIEQTHYSAALNTAIQFRDFWRSLPQLNDPTGLNQMAEECDKLIDQLQAN
ncbi:MAG TPA: hypothetical protein VHT28_19220 [Silvibacterium sp.]|nr:hypothetical protein [Silvibacterium sp.]